MSLKYSKEIIEVETREKSVCLNESYAPTIGQYFRFTFEEITHPNNFKPVALIQQIPKTRCNHWSLSMFNSEENAISFFREAVNKQKKLKKNLSKSYGEYLAKGNLTLEDGMKGPDNLKGHFEYFSNEGVDFEKKFTIIKKLI